MNRWPQNALVWRPRITVSDATQRRFWENLKDLRDVSEEMPLINLLETSQRFANQPSLRCLLDAVWEASKMHLRCIHAGWDITRLYSYVYQHVPLMYSYVISMSLVRTCISSLYLSYVVVCHPYVTRMYSYVIRMLLICDFTMNSSKFLHQKRSIFRIYCIFCYSKYITFLFQPLYF